MCLVVSSFIFFGSALAYVFALFSWTHFIKFFLNSHLVMCIFLLWIHHCIEDTPLLLVCFAVQVPLLFFWVPPSGGWQFVTAKFAFEVLFSHVGCTFGKVASFDCPARLAFLFFSVLHSSSFGVKHFPEETLFSLFRALAAFC